MKDVLPFPGRRKPASAGATPDGARRPASRLPPLNLFRAFDAAVRHGSFRLAADEMCVTPSAVSQQIRQLEDALETRLFRRLTRRVELTREGQALAGTVKDALAILSAGCERLTDPSVPTVVCISVTPTLGLRWLVGRLKRFMAENERIRIALVSSNDPLNFERQDVDLGIRWGQGPFPGARAERLADDVIFPVCNPAFVDHTTIRRLEDLCDYTLVQAVQNGVTWATWLDRMDASHLIPSIDTLSYNDSNIMLEAVACGQGIGLSNSFLAENDLRSGRLTRLFSCDIGIEDGYFILSSASRPDKPAVALVRAWLQAEATLSTRAVRESLADAPLAARR